MQFSTSIVGPIDLAPVSTPGELLLNNHSRREDYRELRSKALDLKSMGTNRLGRLHRPIARFLELPEALANVRTKLFWSRINTLRVRLADHDRAVADLSNRHGDPDERELEPVAASNLKDLVETVNVFIIGDPELMELDAVRPGPQEEADLRIEINAFNPILKDAFNNRKVATEAARDVLKEQVGNLENRGGSLFERQEIEFSRRSIRNFMGEILRRTYTSAQALAAATRVETGSAWKGMREGAYRTAGATVSAGVASDLLGVTNFSGEFIKLVTRHADSFVAYVTKAFQNPALVEIVNWIAKLGA